MKLSIRGERDVLLLKRRGKKLRVLLLVLVKNLSQVGLLLGVLLD